MDKLTIRVRSGRFPFQRAGVVMREPRAWQTEEIDVSPAGAAQLLALVQEPVLAIQAEFDGVWRALTGDDIKAIFSDVAVAAVEGVISKFTPEIEQAMRLLGEAMIDAVREGRSPVPALDHLLAGIDHFKNLPHRDPLNTELPTTEPTLEREHPDTVAAAEGTDGPASVEEAAPTAEAQNAPTATHTDTPESKGDAEGVATTQAPAAKAAAPGADGTTNAKAAKPAPAPKPKPAAKAKAKGV